MKKLVCKRWANSNCCNQLPEHFHLLKLSQLFSTSFFILNVVQELLLFSNKFKLTDRNHLEFSENVFYACYIVRSDLMMQTRLNRVECLSRCKEVTRYQSSSYKHNKSMINISITFVWIKWWICSNNLSNNHHWNCCTYNSRTNK